MDGRPDPEKLLRQIQTDESKTRRGKLKLFFGANPGVGKTYAMLEAGRLRKKEGLDVLVGVVETHGRAETAALLEGLEVLPRAVVQYRGIPIQEFDLDAAIKRRPQLILVDELAHTNAQGSRHSKRWQDVAELLEAGINVYTTMNVQHWESLNDVVAQITHIVVKETVPDTFLQNVHDLEVVDLPPEELLQRLKDGKVYQGGLAEVAAGNFFKPVNLIALRELALRHTAERVDAQMLEFKESHDIKDVWHVGDRILVGVTSSPMCARLIRAASRIAARLHCPWIAAHIETPALLRTPGERNRVAQLLRFAEELGAETVIRSGENAPDEILRLARARNVTRIIVGKPAKPRWKDFFVKSIVNELARSCGEIDLYVISGSGNELRDRKKVFSKPSASWRGVLWGIVTVLASTLLCAFLLDKTDRVNLAMIYLLGLVWVAYRFGRFPSLIASLLSVLTFDFFFVPPYLTFAVSDTQYIFTFAAMLGVGILVSTLTGRLRLLTEASRQRQSKSEVLYRLSRSLAEIHNPIQLVQYAHAMIEEYFRTASMILVPDNGTLRVAAGSRTAFASTTMDDGTAAWVFDHGQPAGAGTDTLAGASALYVPLRSATSTVGVLAIKKGALDPADFEQLRLIETFASVIAGSLESTQLAETAGKAEAQAETEKLKNIVLESFAIDLERPLDILVETMLELNRSIKFAYEEAGPEIRAVRQPLTVALVPFYLNILSHGIRDAYARAFRLKNLTRELPAMIETRILGQSGARQVPRRNLEHEVARALCADRIVFFRGNEDRNAILSELVARLDLPNPAGAITAIREREESSSTIVSDDLCIPHTRLDGIEVVKAALGVVEQPGPMSPRLWLLFVSPLEPIRDHLSFLAAVARLFSRPGFSDSLLSLDTPEKMFAHIRSTPAEVSNSGAPRLTGPDDD